MRSPAQCTGHAKGSRVSLDRPSFENAPAQARCLASRLQLSPQTPRRNCVPSLSRAHPRGIGEPRGRSTGAGRTGRRGSLAGIREGLSRETWIFGRKSGRESRAARAGGTRGGMLKRQFRLRSAAGRFAGGRKRRDARRHSVERELTADETGHRIAQRPRVPLVPSRFRWNSWDCHRDRSRRERERERERSWRRAGRDRVCRRKSATATANVCRCQSSSHNTASPANSPWGGGQCFGAARYKSAQSVVRTGRCTCVRACVRGRSNILPGPSLAFARYAHTARGADWI